MKKTIFKTGLFLVVALLAMSCSKDGEAGPAGPAGANGINGNANVIGTNTVTVSSWTSSNNGALWSASLSASGITQNIVDRGIVSVFMQVPGGWSAMPYAFANFSWSYDFGLGVVVIYKTNNNAAVISNPGSQTFRIVIISPTNKMANPKTNWKDYNEVKRALNLAD